MKLIIALSVFSASAFAQMPSMETATALVKDKGQKIFKGCKDDRKNVKACEKYTEVAPLKECLLKNKEALSAGCKKAVTE